MALGKDTQYANRFGMNLEFFAITDTELATPLLTVDFANEVAVDLSGDTVWATGGQSHANKVPFNDPMEGTLTISTQLMTTELLAMIAGKDMTKFSGNEVVFNNNDANKFYIITGTTVWKDKDGVTYAENIKCFKASPQRAYNVTYTGTGDPSSMDIVFNMAEDDDGNVYSTKKADAAEAAALVAKVKANASVKPVTE